MNGLPLSWFDIVVGVLLIVGIVRGRKLGMSGELLPLLQWAGIVVGGAFGYAPLGAKFYQFIPIGALWCNVLAYLAIAAAVTTVFSMLKRKVGERITSGELFGKGEYYFGMVAGGVRYALIVVTAVALFNGRLYSTAELAASLKENQANFGSDFFPRFGTIHQAVVVKSLVGQQLNANVAVLLMKPTPATPRPLTNADSLGNRRTRELDSIVGH